MYAVKTLRPILQTVLDSFIGELRRLKRAILILLYLTLVSETSAQHVVKGKVTVEQTSEGLPYASIVISGTNVGTVTDAKGEFEFTQVDSITHITVSSVGFERQEVKVIPHGAYVHVTLTSKSNSSSEVVVVGHSNHRKLSETAGGISYLARSETQRSSNVSLAQSLNSVPGVRMEESGFGGSSRLSIRGSLLRSPWGLRNIKVYWNDLPLTDATGSSSAFNAIDVQSVGSIEVLKGPSGSLYGAGIGGVMLVSSSRAKFGDEGVETGVTLGSFGLLRITSSVMEVSSNSDINISLIGQQLDGFRDHNAASKKVFNLAGNYYPNENRRVSVFVLHSDSNYELPGALDSIETETNPRAAHPYAEKGDNRVAINRTILGLSQSIQLAENFSNTTGLYGTFHVKDNPWGTGTHYNGYTEEAASGFGIRTRFTYAARKGSLKARVTVGGEYQLSAAIEKQYANNSGERGEMKNDWEHITQQGMLFTQMEFDLPLEFIVTMGASLNFSKLDIEDRLVSADMSQGLVTDFPPTFAPRFGLVKKIGDFMSVHGSIGYGFSPPTNWEVQTPAGINRNLRPESAMNYEVGARGAILQRRLNYDLGVYMLFLSNSIVSRVNESEEIFFSNSGSVEQLGVEIAISYSILDDSKNWLSVLRPWISYAYSRYHFRKFFIENYNSNISATIIEDYSGNSIPGVAPNVVGVGVDLELKHGLRINTVMNFIDEMPVNNENTKSMNSYVLLGLKCSWERIVAKRFRLNVFGGIDNALDSNYNIFVAINGVNGRYYNPGPLRNYYGGLSFKWIVRD
jgi:iron complex outermembrane recepter protein